MPIQIYYPEQLYPEVYEDVMQHQLFPDSKTFADAVALLPFDEINTKYQQVDRSDRDKVLAFVLLYFQIPHEPVAVPILKTQTTSQHIHALWDVLLRKPDMPQHPSSFIPLPYSYIVPGGRFREIYYWDSYFTMLGLRISGKIEVIHDMLKNFAWQIDQFGHIPNGNRSYFLSRSQPPFFSLMVTLLAEIKGPEIYLEFLQQLVREHSFWMDGADGLQSSYRRVVKVSDSQYLNRYYDDSNTPRAESWAEDMRLHDEHPEKSMDLFRNLRAACESGWDFSSRWLADIDDLSSIRTTDIVPVDLNALLYMLEKTIAKAYFFNNQDHASFQFETMAEKRAASMDATLWNEELGIFSDWLHTSSSEAGIPSLAMVYPLFAGIATPLQAERSLKFMADHFFKPGGWVTTLHHSGQQWDGPNGWAPLQWITYIGLKNYGMTEVAKDGARQWLQLNDQVFKRTGRMMEKYNVEDLSLEAGGGEYPVQGGFGWTNGVYLALAKELELPS